MKKIYASLLILFFFSIGSLATTREQAEQWAKKNLQQMSIDEKIGQLFIFNLSAEDTEKNRKRLREAVVDCKVGGLLFWRGTIEEQARLTNYAQTLSQSVPLLVTLDGEWGLNMRLSDGLRYPRKLTMSAMNNEQLIARYAREMARQCRELRIQFNIDPVVDVNLNPNNPVINIRAFSDDPQLVARYATIMHEESRKNGVFCVPKHFPGHGDTHQDSHHELATVEHSLEQLQSVDLLPYQTLIDNHLLDALMVGHIAVPALDSTCTPATLSYPILTDLLRKKMGFDGLIMTDAFKMGVVRKMEGAEVKSLQAGVDLILDPMDLSKAVKDVKKAVKDGRLTEQQIDEKCFRILTYKYLCGLSNYNPIEINGLVERINTSEACRLQTEMSRAAITMLKNDSLLLPLKQDEKTLLVLMGKDSTCHFATQLKNYLQDSLQVVVVSSEQMQNKDSLMLNDTIAMADVVVFAQFTKEIAVEQYESMLSHCNGKSVVVGFISPYLLRSYTDCYKSASSFVMAYEMSESAQDAVAKALMGEFVPTGKLPVDMDSVCFRKFDEHQLLSQNKNRYRSLLPIVEEAIAQRATPGCQLVVADNQQLLYSESFGKTMYDDGRSVLNSDMYDLASLTKISATLFAVMKLFDEKKISLSDSVTHFLPQFSPIFDKITIQDLLYHESGLPASLPFYYSTIEKLPSPFIRYKKRSSHVVQVDENAYADTSFVYKKSLISTKDSVGRLPIARDMFVDEKVYNDSVEARLSRVKIGKKKYQYSDVNFLLLQKICEKVTNIPLSQYVDSVFYKPLGMKRTMFLPLRHVDVSEIVPSAYDRLFRRQLIHGYPHDENAAFLGGVAGHAGLFSSAESLLPIFQMLLNRGEYQGVRYLSRATCELFLSAQSDKSHRGLGFNRWNIKVDDSTEKIMLGHTGFTGTCVFFDVQTNLIYIFLSNRVYPNAWNKKLLQLNTRSHIAEELYRIR